MAGIVRWADMLCSDCTAELLARPEQCADRMRRMAEQDFDCEVCRRTTQNLAMRHGGAISTRSFGDLPQAARGVMTATHEAGHAVAALAFGYPVLRAWIDEHEAAGQVEWDLGDGVGVRRDEAAAAFLAGKAAQRRWLDEQGIRLDTAGAVDLHWGATGDVLALQAKFGGIPAGAQDKAAEVVASEWQRITRLGTELHQHGHLDAHGVRRAARPVPPGQSVLHRSTQPVPPAAPAAAATATTEGSSMSSIEEIRGVLTRATEETEQAQRSLAQAAGQLESARAAVAHAAQSSAREEIQQVLAQYGDTTQQLQQLGGRMAASVEQIRTYSTQL